jgi:hypothetical protein
MTPCIPLRSRDSPLTDWRGHPPARSSSRVRDRARLQAGPLGGYRRLALLAGEVLGLIDRVLPLDRRDSPPIPGVRRTSPSAATAVVAVPSAANRPKIESLFMATSWELGQRNYLQERPRGQRAGLHPEPAE